jgi:hypoxanthine-DNA glycosylase
MTVITRNRTIRPSTRLEKSKSYKIDTKNITRSDILIVNIDHETKSFQKTFKFNGADVAHKDSISFRAHDLGTSIDIRWSGANPIDSTKAITHTPFEKNLSIKVIPKGISINSKKSFEPISSPDTTILILGTMPGDKSLEIEEYYGHSRNRFWSIISTITGNQIPTTYLEKKNLLLKTKIGIWDVAKRAIRKGSLDDALINEEPNDLENFITKHKHLKVIGFNGKKSEELFNKYFKRKPEINYISLPSTSPANTRFDFDNICMIWRQILKD